MNSHIVVPIKQVLTIESRYGRPPQRHNLGRWKEWKHKRSKKINKAGLTGLIWRFVEKPKCCLFNLSQNGLPDFLKVGSNVHCRVGLWDKGFMVD